MIKNLFELNFSEPKEVRLKLIKRYLNAKFPLTTPTKPIYLPKEFGGSTYTVKQIIKMRQKEMIKEFKQKQRNLNKKELI